ncbi:putative bifunctional UDP-N-acetylglucosamine transferase and deubiquitinase ALG13 isoform X6 [Pimephales promelas]|uniref:putative bifunctional UDP-N-acetylglucosamine transferase and deubiquitinase ALG13 isoform X6 n=1 Tax=Pimephales promelas TaxID=90988 RepID=UPI001955D0A9|nr:putative bifunctional UDP-N-acetylglucosamine transferase and deubiquitinase ALG13 isoform X6 [Pimephales promelas]KAG1970010.1 putative bifunctional UDP-N-acetylglucosamine transferase and deubiquitinase ALG13 [Pimephales promelas]
MQKPLKKYFVNMDEYLASIGLYRKMMARDASCLFRAVSEQLYFSQNYHQRIRKQCANFMRANRCNFEPFVQGSFEKYLERLEDPTETTGQVEIKALSLVYRRCFVIYRYPGKPPTEIAEEDNLPKILLCCSNNGHYDIVYPKNYPMDAALCQALLYELLYTRVLGVEEEELQVALEGFKGGGRRYRNSQSMCSEDAGYDTPEDRPQREEWESSGHCRSEDKSRAGAEDQKATEGSGKLVLPYKVLKALEPELYRNVEFDVWQDSRKELQKTDYMVFAGRQYFLGDKCQVRLDPKGKYYNAFIQEVGSHTTAVTVFIEELAEKHLVSLSNLKPVNPVPAWNITPSRKGNSYNHPEQYTGELDPEMRGRRRFFKKPRGVHGPAQPPPGLAYEHYRPHPSPRPPRGYGPPSSGRFLNRHHLIGPDMAYYPSPGKRCYQSFDNYSFRSRRSRRQMHSLNKECLSCVPEPGEDTQDMEGSITFYEIEETDESAFSPIPGQAVSSPMVPGATAYWVPRVPSPIPPSGKQTMTSSEEDPDERNTAGEGDYSEEYIYAAAEAGYQNPSVYAAAAESTTNLTIQEGSSRAGSPQEGVATYSYSQQVVVKSSVLSSSQQINSAPAAIFTSNSSSSSTGSSQTPPNPLPPNSILTPGQPPPQSVLGRPAVPWFVNELGEPVALAPPPPYSYDPNGSDLPRDYKVLQYYYNLGVQWYQQSYWHSVVQMQQVYQQPAADAQYQPYSGVVPTADHTVPQAYPDPVRTCPHPQGDVPSNGASLAMESPPTVVPGTVFYPLVQEQCGQQPLHPSYEPYVPVLSTTYHYLTPWTHGAGPHPRIHHATYCPSSSHSPVNYITQTHPGHMPHSQFV